MEEPTQPAVPPAATPQPAAVDSVAGKRKRGRPKKDDSQPQSISTAPDNEVSANDNSEAPEAEVTEASTGGAARKKVRTIYSTVRPNQAYRMRSVHTPLSLLHFGSIFFSLLSYLVLLESAGALPLLAQVCAFAGTFKICSRRTNAHALT